MTDTTNKLVSIVKPRRRWLQFRLLTLFVLVTVICVFLAVRENRQQKRRAAIAKIMSLGGDISHSRTLRMPDRLEVVEIGPWARLMGDRPCIIVFLDLDGATNVTDADLLSLLPLVEMRWLIVSKSGSITDAGLMNLASLPNLIWISLSGSTNVTDHGLAALQKICRNA